ncbi:MarR family winged helix-turn-helix transcriptional regulator [Actinomadura sp. 6K520]|jgi:DNA-binding MarR family transcriptional regulator|uniref:MarR family winged helix-turn-helix transcriptional regulator n=1 Tax=Actinomadura sp. 6K520 TaxID=2530364 RepID=UPI00104B4184|nr:MarR family winged helix-turn-helix transcriptional regulator [Actinomadura sp. 6K520]TDE37662.1 MarR family transcriptional regulator [Actinomadura sp. 6K520]
MAAAARPSASSIRLANESWEALFRAQATLAREFERDGDRGGLPPREYGVLYALAGADEGLRITDLIDDALLTQAGVSRLVSRLERRGLVERRDDPDDARACRIVLTAEGRNVQRRVGRAHARHVTRAMTRALDREQLAILRDLTKTLIYGSDRWRAPPARSALESQHQTGHEPTRVTTLGAWATS